MTSLLPKARREDSAAPARDFARVSKKRPRITKKITPAATSVYTSPTPVVFAYIDQANAAIEPIEIKLSIVGCFKFRSAAR